MPPDFALLKSYPIAALLPLFLEAGKFGLAPVRASRLVFALPPDIVPSNSATHGKQRRAGFGGEAEFF
jgi:hypothetical protein